MRCGISCGAGSVTNDTFHALRAFTRPPDAPRSGSRRARRRVPQPARRAAVGRRRWSLHRAIAPARAVSPTRMVDRDGAAAARALRRADARSRGRRGHRRRVRRRLRRAQGAWRTPAASAAATSSPASARRSSRCRPRSICCARCASCRTSRRRRARRHRSRQPVRHDAEVAVDGRRGRDAGRPRRRRAPSARSSCS